MMDALDAAFTVLKPPSSRHRASWSLQHRLFRSIAHRETSSVSTTVKLLTVISQAPTPLRGSRSGPCPTIKLVYLSNLPLNPSRLPRSGDPGRDASIRNRTRTAISIMMLNDMHLLPHRSPRTLNLARIRHFRMGHVLDRRRRRLAHPPRLLPSPTALRRLLAIRGQVKADKQQQITAQDTHARKRSKFLARAFPGIGHPRKIGVREVGVGGEVDEAEIDDELQDLQAGDVLFPPDLDAAGGLEVVPVHDDVHEEIDGNGNPGDGGEADQLRVAEEGGGTVMVGVEEGKRFLFEDHKDCVEELKVFGKVIELLLSVSGAFSLQSAGMQLQTYII